MLVTGIGRKLLEFELRFKLTRSGGWRIVAGRVPVATATALDLLVPSAKTEVRIGIANAADTESVNLKRNRISRSCTRRCKPTDNCSCNGVPKLPRRKSIRV